MYICMERYIHPRYRMDVPTCLVYAKVSSGLSVINKMRLAGIVLYCVLLYVDR